MLTFSYGTCPSDVITQACKEQCPDGYKMTIKNQDEWLTISNAVNQGIDSHLEAVTERSTFDAETGECLVHPEELHVLLRRFYEAGDDESMDFRVCILSTLNIEEI